LLSRASRMTLSLAALLPPCAGRVSYRPSGRSKIGDQRFHSGTTSRLEQVTGRRHAPDNAWLVRKTIPCLIVLGGNKPSEVARARRHHPRGRRLRSAARSIPPLHKAPEQSAHNATSGVMPSREDRNNRISALKFSGTMPPQLPVLFALIQILLGCDRRRRIRAPFGAL